jgi:xanthine/uracil/vitamin C permease (AzgA family)
MTGLLAPYGEFLPSLVLFFLCVCFVSCNSGCAMTLVCVGNSLTANRLAVDGSK